ncbi:MAG: ABC transporter permease [Phycisphaerales bacterium]|nr:ABC transporter permease [Phycisphaerales bacterium]
MTQPLTRTNPLMKPAMAWADMWIDVLGFLGSLWYLLSDVVTWAWRTAILRQEKFGFHSLTEQINRVGIRSIGIVMLVSGAIGIILALQTAPSLEQFGQIDKVANLVGVAVTRELGPLIAAIVLTGFAGASIAAELGTMVVGEEIEALESMALSPTRYLVMPRVIATASSLVVLAVIADATSVLAGAATGVLSLGIPYAVYRDNTLMQLAPIDFLTGLFKAGVFGIILGLIACRNGLRVSGGAAGVGRATTATVVQTIITIVIADLLFTAVFFALGWNGTNL